MYDYPEFLLLTAFTKLFRKSNVLQKPTSSLQPCRVTHSSCEHWSNRRCSSSSTDWNNSQSKLKAYSAVRHLNKKVFAFQILYKFKKHVDLVPIEETMYVRLVEISKIGRL